MAPKETAVADKKELKIENENKNGKSAGKNGNGTNGDGRTIFRDVPSPMQATRYHSLIVSEKSFPRDLEISAYTNGPTGEKVIMGLRHKRFPVEGVQFHPESVLTTHGKQLIRNFLTI